MSTKLTFLTLDMLYILSGLVDCCSRRKINSSLGKALMFILPIPPPSLQTNISWLLSCVSVADVNGKGNRH